jgi:hypothetical protein
MINHHLRLDAMSQYLLMSKGCMFPSMDLMRPDQSNLLNFRNPQVQIIGSFDFWAFHVEFSGHDNCVVRHQDDVPFQVLS